MEIISVKTKEEADKLYENSALTIEGLAEESYGDLIEWVKRHTAVKAERLYVIEGFVMNLLYGLTGNNAYPTDAHIVCMMLDDMENASAIFLPRFEIKGRWFDDVVDNNRRREEANS